MPKFKGRISDRGKWDENKMKEAVKNVMEGKLSVRQAADRTPESTSIARAVGFNKPQVSRFFGQLNHLQEKYKFPPSRIYNTDETGVSNVHKNDKVISIKGKKQVGKLTSAERGRNITLTFAMNVTGHFIPPLFIFPRKKMDKNGRLMIGAPPDSIATPQESGWMNGEVFFQWLQHFKQHVQPTETNPVLLILDGHASHKELAVIKYARNHHIHMLSTPPHTTHKLQPLDRTFFKPFKSAFATASSAWMRRNPAARITDYDIAALVDEAFSRAARLDIAQNGFKCTGIYPFNPEIFTDIDFFTINDDRCDARSFFQRKYGQSVLSSTFFASALH
ncbi:unnamed protein product [Parnassius apollo]|uniref:(apollo) hypothetical protein n=1 Tax=Parnassius apollo TaxID=110799 RepID=A0A8S3XE08_PARAO|nr:unnamed protein product [Parnassius apollo]